jgi:hypothetical protein
MTNEWSKPKGSQQKQLLEMYGEIENDANNKPKKKISKKKVDSDSEDEKPVKQKK